MDAGGRPGLRLSRNQGQRPADLQRSLAFARALNRLGAGDPAVHKQMLEVQHLISPPSVLRTHSRRAGASSDGGSVSLARCRRNRRTAGPPCCDNQYFFRMSARRSPGEPGPYQLKTGPHHCTGTSQPNPAPETCLLIVPVGPVPDSDGAFFSNFAPIYSVLSSVRWKLSCGGHKVEETVTSAISRRQSFLPVRNHALWFL